MTSTFIKKPQNSRHVHNGKNRAEIIQLLKAKRDVERKHYFILEQDLERILQLKLATKKQQDIYKKNIFDLDAEIKKLERPKLVSPKYDYTSFFVFVGIVIAIFIFAVYSILSR